LPITGRTARTCLKTFRDHLAGLLAQTVPTTCPVLIAETDAGAHIGFRQADAPRPVPIATNHGELFFWVAQLVRAKKEGAHYVLSTWQYWYRLQASDSLIAPALIRWEYDRKLRGGEQPCRHHVQQQATIKVPDTGAILDLDKLHVPTGWVTLEEVLRFLIYDLKMRPPCGARWPAVLEASEKVFREQFSTPH
jgi:hypothetical protein